MVGAGRDDRAAELLKTFNAAVSLHVSGRLAEAAVLYEDLLRRLPRHPDVLDYYGTLRHQVGDHANALSLIERAVALRPLAGATRNRLGSVQKSLGDRRAAESSFRRAAASDPHLAESAVNIAGLLGEGGAPQSALTWCDRALAGQPKSFDALVRRGAILNGLGRFREALDDLVAARRQQPLHPEVWLHLTTALAGVGAFDAAVQAVRSGIVAAPATYELYPALAVARGPLNESDEAQYWAQRAPRIKPTDAKLWANLASELYRASEPDLAFRASLRSVVLDPGQEAGMQALAAASFQRNLIQLSGRVCRRALLSHPQNADISYTMAEVEFIGGDLGLAWDLHERRVDRQMFRPRLALPPAWNGPGSEEGPLLVASEQGVGDEVIFLSCLPDLLRQVRVPVVVEVDQRIVPVMTRTFPAVTVIPRQLVPGDALGQFFDYAEVARRYGLRHSVLSGSLPRYFRNDRERPTRQGGYLRPDPDRVSHWRGELSRFKPNLTVGVVWRSALMTKYRSRFHSGIIDWEPVFRTPGCTFINLMYGEVTPELDQLRKVTGVTVENLPGIDLWNDIDDLLALLAAVDVVVAARTANCAFAAAVGAPTIRVAQNYSRISDGRDFFFANVWPTLPRDQPFDARRAAETAARLLRERVAGP